MAKTRIWTTYTTFGFDIHFVAYVSLVIDLLQMTKHTQPLFTEMCWNGIYTQGLHENILAGNNRLPIANKNGKFFILFFWFSGKVKSYKIHNNGMLVA